MNDFITSDRSDISFPVHDLRKYFGADDLYDLYDFYDLAHVAEMELYNLHDLYIAHASLGWMICTSMRQILHSLS